MEKQKLITNFILLTVLWSILIMVLAVINYNGFYNNSLLITRSNALNAFNKDLVYRRWAALHGGVYVPATNHSPPNPYLNNIPERDIETPSGKKLTLVNPAYMTRQVQELGFDQYGLYGHITSLKPLRDMNVPDEWENQALTAFEQGVEEVASIAAINGEDYYRLMRPMITEQGCLKCHEKHGYTIGDIRGGISVSIPWFPVRQQLHLHLMSIVYTFGGIWLLGFIGAGFIMRRIHVDMKSQKRVEDSLRSSEHKYKSLFDNMNQGMALHEIILDTSGQAVDYRFIDANAGFERLTGLKRDNILGKTVLELMPRTETTFIEKYGEVTATGKPIFFEDYSSELNRFYEVVAYRPQPGQFAVIISDVTDRRKSAAEIARKNSELQSLNAQKDKFFSIIAHDLKSPFNSIIGFSQLLSEQVKENDYQDIAKYAEIIEHSSERAMELLANLMEWTQTQTGRMEFAPGQFDLSDHLTNTFVLFNSIAAQKSITLKKIIPTGLLGFADKAMISTVMRNLISNAIKFSRPHSEITVKAEVQKNELMISVSDHGVGIPKEGIEKLFRIDENYTTAGTQKEQGTGLGLILCLEFIKKHGGRIWVDSEVGAGSVFYFTIPAHHLVG